MFLIYRLFVHNIDKCSLIYKRDNIDVHLQYKSITSVFVSGGYKALLDV